MRFWHRTRTDYFTQGLTDGRKAAADMPPTLGVDTAQIHERALFAGAALSGRVAPSDALNYQSGWVEGYTRMRERATQNTAAPVTG